jgi:hypothetical protein
MLRNPATEAASFNSRSRVTAAATIKQTRYSLQFAAEQYSE